MNKQKALSIVLSALNKQAKIIANIKSTLELGDINNQELSQAYQFLQTLEEPKKEEKPKKDANKKV